MISTIIIEDDPLSSELLASTLSEVDDDIEVKAVLRSVREGVHYFRTVSEVDLIFSDIQLTDGLSFDIFSEVSVSCPIIFTSAYDQYLVNVFEYSGIDYLLKPVSRDQLAQAVKKYRSLQRHFVSNQASIKSIFNDFFTSRKTRIIVKKGIATISLVLSDVVFFYTENLVVYAVDNKGSKYMVDKSLNTLEQELDKKIFFRANRQYILNIDYIQGYKNYERVKLLVNLNIRENDHLIIVGQEKARSFRHWLAEG